MAKKFTNKELREFGRDLKIAKATVMHMWGFTDEEIQNVTGMPDFELKRALYGETNMADKTEK